MYKEFLKDSGVVGLGNVITRGLGALFFILIARLYTPEDLGYINYSITVATIASAIAVSGFPMTLSRFLGKAKGNEKRMSVYYTNFVVSMAFLTLISIVLTIGVTKYLSKFNIGMLAVAIGLVVYWSYFGLIRGLLHIKKIFAFKTSNNLMKIILVCIVSYLGISSNNLILVIYGLSCLIPIAFLEKYRPSKIKLNLDTASKKVLKELTIFSSPLIVMGIAYNVLFGVDVFFLEYYRNLEEVGIYSVAKTLTTFFILVPDAVTTILMPTVARVEKKEGIKHLKIALIITSLASALLLLFLVLFGSPLIRILFTAKYLRALEAIYILSIGIGLYSLNFVLGEYLIGIGKPQIYSKIQILAMVTAILGSYIFVPGMGMFGAGLALASGFGLAFIVLSISTVRAIKSLPA